MYIAAILVRYLRGSEKKFSKIALHAFISEELYPAHGLFESVAIRNGIMSSLSPSRISLNRNRRRSWPRGVLISAHIAAESTPVRNSVVACAEAGGKHGGRAPLRRAVTQIHRAA
jgi:hypothetical protein